MDGLALIQDITTAYTITNIVSQSIRALPIDRILLLLGFGYQVKSGGSIPNAL